MNALAAALLLLAVFASLYHVTAAVCAVFFARKSKSAKNSGPWPRATCLKPLCGEDFELTRNLESFLEQDYPCYDVICGVSDSLDPAYTAASRVCSQSGAGRCRAVSGEVGNDANRKIRNLRNMDSHVPPETEILVLSDSDIRVGSDYLKRMIAPLRDDPAAGATTALYRIENAASAGAVIEALAVEATFAPGVLVAATFSHLRFAFGASIAVRRTHFAESGGFAAIEDYLADDYQIGHRIFKLGKRVVLAPYVAAIYVEPEQSVRATISHLIRWNRTIRVCQPTGYFFSILGNPVIWALAGGAALGPVATAGAVLAVVLATRIVTAAIVAACLGSRRGIVRAGLSPLWDVLSALLWLVGFAGSRVIWRGVAYTILADGRLAEIHE